MLLFLEFVLNLDFYVLLYLFISNLFLHVFENTMTALIFRLAHEILNTFFHWHHFINMLFSF